MLHTLLTIDRPLIIFDLETTSLIPADARIVEIGFQIWSAMGLQKEWSSYVNPGIPIPEESIKIHHITDAMVNDCRICGRPHEAHAQPLVSEPTECDVFKFRTWPTFHQLATNLAKGFSNCDFAGKNVRYDLQVLSAEMSRAGVSWSYADAKIIDADRLEALGEPRTLSDLYKKHTGRELEGEHGALADVRAVADVITIQLQKYQSLPRFLTALHEVQWPNMIDLTGHFKYIDGIPCVAFGKWRGKPMNVVDQSYWDWIISNDFDIVTKTIAANAKLRKFPEVRQNG